MGLLGSDFLVLVKFSNPALGNEEKIMHGEKTYPEVVHHCSLGKSHNFHPKQTDSAPK
jgi:hypothetical protein